MKPSPTSRLLSRKLYWDMEEQVLWLDLRQIWPDKGVLRLPSWDQMMLSAEPIPQYAPALDVLSWSIHSELRFWLQQIPKWVVESCQLFPSHQLSLLHYAGRYPQMLELLEHAPLLAWELVRAPLTESERVALFQAKRTDMVEKLGWPGKSETLKFLCNLRLRQVNNELLEQVQVCLLDEKRLNSLQALPRINSMALSLAARFPELIGQRLHQSLARMPCRPMQCKSMIALLEDVYRLAEFIGEADVTRKIGDCRYLVEVETLYQAWLNQTLGQQASIELELTSEPECLTHSKQWQALSRQQHQAWWLDAGQPNKQLWAWLFEGEPVGLLLDNSGEQAKIQRLRQAQNQLASAALQAQVELWLVNLNKA